MFHVIARHGAVLAFLLALLTGSAVVLGILAALNLVAGQAFAGTLGAALVAWLCVSHYAVAVHGARHSRRTIGKAERRLTDTIGDEHVLTRSEVLALRDEIHGWRRAADDQHVADLMASVDPDQDNIRRLR